MTLQKMMFETGTEHILCLILDFDALMRIIPIWCVEGLEVLDSK